MYKIHDKYIIKEELNKAKQTQYRIIAPVECPSAWRGAQNCTIAIIYNKKLAYKLFDAKATFKNKEVSND